MEELKAKQVKTIRLITIIRKSDQVRILDAQSVDSLEINFYSDRVDIDFIKDDINYSMNIKESSNYKIIIE